MIRIVDRGHGREAWVLACSLSVALFWFSPAEAQTCTQANPPVFNYQFPTASDDGPGGMVTADGRVTMMALPNNAPASAAAELALFNPTTGQLTYLTSGSASVTDNFGILQQFPKRVVGVARDGSVVAISGSAALDFPVLQLPGAPAPVQVNEVVGIPGPVELINTQSGARRAIGSLSGVPLNSDELYLGQSGGFNADASKVLLSEQIVRVQPTVIDGSTRLIVPPGGFLAFSASLVRTSDGALVADITQRINTRAGGNAFIQGFIQMSGDANAFSFASSVDLSNPSLPLWSQVTANGPRIRRAPYVYFLDSDQIVSVVSIDVTQPRQGGSSLVFLRNIGRTGTVFGIERGVSYIGAPPNPSGATNPATLVLGQVPQYITPPGALPPARGFFANSFALISPEEDRVYFQHTADLVPGNNLIQSQEIFSIQLSNRQIRQISRQQDTIGVRFANEPTLLFQYGDLAQIVYAGSSADHRVVAYSNNRPGGFTRTVKDVDAQGRTTIRAARFGTAEYPAWEVRRIMVCQ